MWPHFDRAVEIVRHKAECTPREDLAYVSESSASTAEARSDNEANAGKEPRDEGRRPGASMRMDGKPPEVTAAEPPRVGDLDRSLDGTAAEGRARCQPHVAEEADGAANPGQPNLDVGVSDAVGQVGDEETYRATYLP